ncbi:MAG TPA: hypothetical protein DGK91_06840 [Clostridium sp.]|jgi:hypothetical protein|nr:hypothetical protein [Clostridium sp.]
MSNNEIEKFEQQFQQEEMEIMVLMKHSCRGASVNGQWLNPAVTFVASIDNASGQLCRKEGRIEWIIKKDPDRKGWGYDFEQYGIYRLLVRKCIPQELSSYQSEIVNNRYMLVKILEEDVQNHKLMELRDYLKTPVTIDSDFGTFILQREYSWFTCDMDWCGKEVSVTLESDEDSEETAKVAMETFLSIAKDKGDFDKKSKEYAADELLDLANDWLEDDDSEDKPDEITRELFIDSIELSELCVNSDGSITLYYSDGNLFWGHVIMIYREADGTYSDANIAG